MKYRVYLVYRIHADGNSVAARKVLQELLGKSADTFEPMQERLVGQIELESPVTLEEEKVALLLPRLAPNASGIRLEEVDWLKGHEAALAVVGDQMQRSGQIIIDDLPA